MYLAAPGRHQHQPGPGVEQSEYAMRFTGKRDVNDLPCFEQPAPLWRQWHRHHHQRRRCTWVPLLL